MLCFALRCCFLLYSHLLKELCVVRLLTGDAFDGRRNCRSLHENSALRTVPRLPGHPELLAAEADEQARSPWAIVRYSGPRISLDWFFFPQDSERQSLRKALPRSWSMALRALRSNRVLGISLADFSNFVYKADRVVAREQDPFLRLRPEAVSKTGRSESCGAS